MKGKTKNILDSTLTITSAVVSSVCGWKVSRIVEEQTDSILVGSGVGIAVDIGVYEILTRGKDKLMNKINTNESEEM